MFFSTSQQGNICVVNFEVKALDAANAKDFKSEISEVLKNENKVLMNMGSLQFIDSSGLGAILSCLKSISAKNGEIKLCNLSKPARIIVELVNMHKVFEIFNSVDEGLKSF